MAGTPFTLQILHGSDFEAGLLATTTARNFAAVVDKLEDTYVNSITLSSGDNFLPGAFNASESDPAIRTPLQNAYASILGVPASSLTGLREAASRVDIAILNAIGIQASAVGNHEFDLGPVPLGDAVNLVKASGAAPTTISSIGAQFPYVSANLNFAGEPSLASRYTAELRDASTYGVTADTLNNPTALNAAAASDRSFAPWTIVTENGERIGIVGVTTQLEASLTSLGGVTVLDPAGDGGRDNTAELAQVLQPYVDQLTAQGVDKVVLLSHLQQYQLELDLATKLRGVDVIIAGGSHELFTNPGLPSRPNQVVAQNYPVIRTGADGNPVAVVNTPNEYTYVGRLVVTFDAQGVVNPASIDPAISGDYATTDAYVQQLHAGADPYAAGTRGGIVKGLTDAVASVIAAKDSNQFGFTDVFLEGRRIPVRTQETNLGNISADANLFVGKQFDPAVAVSFKNGGGIRAEIGSYTLDAFARPIPPGANPAANKPAGAVSQLDIENSLRFNNALSVLSVTAENLARVFEFSAALYNPGTTPGGYGQVGGVAYSFDPSRQAQVLGAGGAVTTAGQRVRNLAVLNTDGTVADTIIRDGVVQGDPSRAIRLVTLSFIADGGDANPLPFYTIAGSRTDLLNNAALPDGAATFAGKGTEQDAMAEYLRAAFGTPTTAFAQAETAEAGDTRIQNLRLRSDTVLQDTVTAPINGGTVTGTAGSNRFIGGAGSDVFTATAGRDTYSGNAGVDVLRFNLGRGAGKVLSDLTGSPINGFAYTDASGYNQSKYDGVERVQFADGRIEHDAASTASVVQRLFAGLLGRQAEVQGTSFFTASANRGASASTIASTMLATSEGAAQSAALSNAAFVDRLYTDVLGRAADAGGAAFWTGRLEAGASRADVAASFATGAEAQADRTGAAARGIIVQDIPATQVGATYRAALGRDVDAGGLQFFTSALNGGASLTDVVRAVTSSGEFAQRFTGVSDAEFLRSLFSSALNRTPEAGGNTFFANQLAAGTSRADVAATIVLSTEGQSVAGSFYQSGIRIA